MEPAGPNNDGASTATGSLTAAEKLRQRHEAEASHRATVEDIIDEEDIAHPPPTMHPPAGSESDPAVVAADGPITAKARGKQRAQAEDEGSPSPSERAEKAVPLNTQSEESFPALGSGPRAPMSASAPSAWGAKKPSSIHHGPNGVNGNAKMPSLTSSRASTPTSGVLTPVSSNAPVTQSSRGLAFPHQMPMPGKHSERIQFAPSQILPRNQLKKPLQDTLRDMNKRSKAKIEMRTGANGTIIFEGRGPVDATRQALKDLAKEVGSKQQVKIPIPLSVRPHVIGRQGAVIQGIQNRTGARVQLPKTGEDALPAALEDDDSQTIDVTIEGDAVAAEMARRDIEAIIAERTSTVNLHLRDIPAEYFPFIAGPHNSRVKSLEDGREIRVQVPHYHTWTDQAPPSPPPAGILPQFSPSASNHIRISGDRLAAQEARAEIERHVAALNKQITMSQIPIDRGRHQFILGHENSLHDFLSETGCAIILPPPTEDSEMLTVTGPQESIESGMDRIMDLASAMQMSRIDIARQHANAPLGSQAHARALTRYLQDRKVIDHLERQYNSRIVLPNDERGSSDWEIYVKEGKNGMRAKQDILGLISAHPPARIRHVEMNPFFHHHVHQHGALKLRDDFGVHLLPPQVTQSPDHLILVYEGPQDTNAATFEPPRQAPPPQQMAEFDRMLQQAQQHILGLIANQQNIGTARVSVAPKYHDKLRRFVQREQEHLPVERVPVKIHFAGSNSVNNSLTNPQEPSSLVVADNEGLLQGPSDLVGDLAAKVAEFVESEKRDEHERGHVTTFDFPQKHMSHLIGRRGETVNKYREDFDVDIQTKDGKVDIIGPKAKADLAKAKIIALAKQLDDEATHVLKIHPKYHREIIGAKGSQVNRLQDRYNVHVQFPRSVNAKDDKSTADDASEASVLRNRRPNQGSDEVIVKGPRKGAGGARDELLNLLQWTIDNSHGASVSVAQKQLPALIGQGGQEMEAIRLESGAQIDVPGKDSIDSSGRVQVQLKGTKKQVEEAKRIIERRSKAFDDTVVRTFDVDRRHHKNLIGSGGSNIRNIVLAAGGSDDRRELARTIRFPPQESEDKTIRVEGDKALVDKIVASIEAFASEREGQTSELIEVVPGKHRLLIGRGGETRRALEAQCKVEINVPKLSEEGPSRSQVKILGQPGDIEKAKSRILEIIQDVPDEIIQVPRKHHHTVSDSGQFFRRLRNEHKVIVDHGDQSPPPKPTPTASPQANDSTLMPLITDDPSTTSAHSFSIMDSGPTSTEEGTIPWVLKGSPENIAKARSALEKALKNAEAQQSQCTGYLVLPDPSTYRFVIGHGGSKINEIRKQTGCRINVPRDQKEGSAIEIVGSREGVEQAKDIIIDVVSSGARRG